MKSIYKNLKKGLILLAIVVSLFNSIYACRTANEILDDCTDFYNEPQQQRGFVFKEEARLCINRVNGLLKDIEEFCISTTIITEKVEASRSWLRLQEAYLELSRAEAQLYLHPAEDEEAFEFLKEQARIGYLDLWPYLSGGRYEGNLNEDQIYELLTILKNNINSTDYSGSMRFGLIIQRPLHKHLSNKSKKNLLQKEEVIKLKEKGFLEYSGWIL